ncbi:phosphotriesterase [Lentisphaerota bacterium ZTH]|nr:phosphotriesterase [Lentisphaerota bacterium]WET05349.1 phosphotriesterase [Lentisphaerota bacterium ZTH]
MSFVRTVLGDIDSKDLGVTDSHDHLIRTGGEEVRENKSFLMDSVSAAKEEFGSFLDVGGKSMMCMDPIGCGRDVPKMLEVAEAYAGRGNIVMTTGFHKAAFYDTRTHWLATNKIDDVVNMCALEIEEGMDENSYNGPVVKRTAAKAGLIKAGTGYAQIFPFEKKALEVAALTQQRTGCPISVHTQLGTMGEITAEMLKGFGADLSHTVLCHLQKNPDRYEYKRILDKGINICFDGPDRVKYYADCILADNIKWLVDRGYQKQILLSMDAGRIEYQTAYMKEKNVIAKGIKWLLTGFVPILKEIGVSEEAVQDMLVNNPARIFAFK